MPETGRRFLAPTAQGTGDGLTAANAALATDRLTHEAALKAAAVADPTLKASGSPANVAIEMCWRADLGSYSGLAFLPDSTHGGISATRKLRHVSVDASGNEIIHSVVRNHATLTTTAIGENDVAMFVGTRTPDPRSALEKDWMINVSAITRYVNTVDFAFINVAVPVGQALKPDGTVHDYGTGAWTAGSTFESPTGTYDNVVWDGFKWKDYQYVFLFGGNLTVANWSALDNFGENIKSFVRNSEESNLTAITVDGLYVRAWSQSLFRMDHGGDHVFKNLDVDSQFQVGDRICGLTQLGVDSGTGPVGPVTFDSFLVKNCWDGDDAPGGYMQGDGVTGNRTSKNIIVTNGVFDTLGDGGVDVKSYSDDPNEPAMHMENVDVYYGKRNMRLWGSQTLLGKGIFSFFRLKNVRSFNPWGDAHLFFAGGTCEWENPAAGVAMTDDPARSDPQAVPVSNDSPPPDHIFCTLRDLTYSFNPGTPSVTVKDNTSTYPTEAAAEAAGAKRILVQEVVGTGWTGTITVEGVTYDFSTIPVTEGDTSRIGVTGVGEGSVTFSLIPPEIGDMVTVDAVTKDVTWRNTDGTLP